MLVASVSHSLPRVLTNRKTLGTIEMNRKDLSMNNIMSLHQELMYATDEYEKFLDERNDLMSEIWYKQMELLTDEMKNLDND